VTSVERLTGVRPIRTDVEKVVAAEFAAVFGRSICSVD